MSDQNLVSFYGYPDGKIELVDLRQPPGHTNQILRESGFEWLDYNVGDIIIGLPEWSDALKVSGCVNLIVRANTITGGKEDVVDVNHSQHVKIYIEDALVRGKYCSTQKGASTDITLDIKRQHGHGTEVDHDYGNHSDQGDGNTTDCKLAVTAGGETIKVRVLRATPPGLLGGPFKWAFPNPFSWYHSIAVWVLNIFQ